MYERVEESDAGGGNGKTVYEFTSLSDQAPLSAATAPYAFKQRVAGWAYGLPKRVSVYDNTGFKTMETENNYNIIVTPITGSNHKSCKCETRKQWAIPMNQWSEDAYYLYSTTATNGEEGITMEFYNPFTGRTELTTSRHRVYTKDGQMQENITRYQYHPLNFMPNKITTTNSRGEEVERRMYYPEDYTLAGPVQKLKDNNAIATPLSEETWVRKPGNAYQLLGASVTEYATISNGDVQPVKTYAVETNQPIVHSQIGDFNPAMLVRNNQYFKQQSSLSYNSEGINTELTAQSRISATIYDYNQRYAVAVVANAAYTDIAYAGFEADGTGGWTYSDEFFNRTQSMTGHTSFILSQGSANISKTGLNPATTYRVSCWAKGGTVQANGQSGVATVTIGDWTLYQFEVTGTNAVGLTGTATIDDLRLHPQNALMTTYTYDPGLGKTSETDATGRITYYDLDGLGRVIKVRDEKRNVIKTIEYNYKQ
jgi:YD repeat-containing protein